MEDLRPLYRRGPGKRSGRVRDLNRGQLIWIGAFGFIGLVMLITTENPLGIVILVIAGAGGWSYNKGVGYKVPGRLLAERSAKHNEGRVGGTAEEAAVFNIVPQDMPGVIGTAYHTKHKTDTVYFGTKGFRSANGDPLERFQADEMIAEAIRRAISQTDFDIHYGYIVGSRPRHPSRWARRVRKHYLHDDALNAEASMPVTYQTRSLEEWLEAIQRGEPHAVEQLGMSNINQAFMDMSEFGKKFYQTFYLTVIRPPQWKEFARHPERFTSDDFEQSPLARVIRAMESGLTAAGYIDVHLETYDEVRERIYDGLEVLKDRERFELGLPLERRPGDPIWPQQAVEQHGKYLRTDNSCHAVLQAIRFPRDEYLPDGLDELLIGNPDYVVVSTQAGTTSAKLDRFYFRQLRSFNFARRASKGALEEQADRDKADSDARRVDEIYLSGSKAIRENISFAISASSPAQLEERVKDQRARIRHPDITVYRLKGESMITGLESALFGTLQ